jgi:hypothetical protein
MGAVERWWLVWRDGDLAAVDEIVAEEFTRHSALGTVVRDRDQVREDVIQFREALELAEVRIDGRSVSGDLTWCRVTTVGVNRNTEEPSTMSWLQCCRVVDGLIHEMWWLYALDTEWVER